LDGDPERNHLWKLTRFVEYKIADPKQIATWINGYYHGAHVDEGALIAALRA
jgi:hypothetical protein